ncbi:MAG TPA: SAM-dependent methyltransferase [Polyangia bacterium]|nr:SAM-dependent methyltransferase [Polyangia bacterium]
MPTTPAPDQRAIQHVSDTAFLVAQFRADESARPDALFRDPLAARLAGDKGKALAAAWPTGRMSGWLLAVRTVVIDELIRAALAGGTDMIVNLGAGLDARPYRLDLPRDLRWIEVDYPAVVAYKERALAGEAPRCHLERVGLDLGDGPGRRALLAGLDARAARMLVLTEGVVPYLDLAAAGALAADLRALAHVGGWIVDYISPESHQYRERAGINRHMRESPFKFKPDDWHGFFAAHGWRQREARFLPAEGDRLGRPVPWPFWVRIIKRVLGPLAPPARREGLDRFAGYIVLEPAPR